MAFKIPELLNQHAKQKNNILARSSLRNNCLILTESLNSWLQHILQVPDADASNKGGLSINLYKKTTMTNRTRTAGVADVAQEKIG